MTPAPDLLRFPCAFPLKVVGPDTPAFECSVLEVFERRLPAGCVEFARKRSSGGKYLSITATFTATGREQLDALYRELNALEGVLLTL